MPGSGSARGYKRTRNPRVDRQTRSSGLETYRKLLEIGGLGFVARPAAGFLSQVMGVDDKGNIGSPITNPLKDRKDRKSIGLVDETLAIPTLIELFGFEAPEFAKRAEARQALLRAAINDDMGIGDPEGFSENALDALGTMLGQLPIPGKKKADIAVSGGKKLSEVAKKILGSGPEFFSPTVDPKLSNYASGAGFGGALGTLGDEEPTEEPTEEQVEEPIEEFALGGKVSLTGFVPRTNQLPVPGGTTSGSTPSSLPGRIRLNGDRTVEQLNNYGMGPETRYFSNFSAPPQVNVLPPLAPNGSRLFGSNLPVSTQQPIPSGGGLSNTLLRALARLRESIASGNQGKAEGGLVSNTVSDEEIDEIASALTNMIAKYRGEM